MKFLQKLKVLLSILFLVVACKEKEEKLAVNKSSNKAITANMLADTCNVLLQDGDIILRTGNDVISLLFSQLNQKNKKYSHCGIAFNEDGKWVVYHSIGGEDNPNERLRRDQLDYFISAKNNLGYGICRYPLSKHESNSLHDTVMRFYASAIPFDMQFDLQSDNRLYCAEMVYKAFNKALPTTSFFETSYHKGFTYVSTDNLFMNNKARILCELVY
jgi:hypothetical protein